MNRKANTQALQQTIIIHSKLFQIPAKSAVRFSGSYKKSPNHQVIGTPIFCSPTTVDEEPNFSMKVTQPLNFKNKYHLLITKKGYASKKINLKIINQGIDYDAKIKQINSKIKDINDQLRPLKKQVNAMEPFIDALKNDDPTSSGYQTALQQANGNAEAYEDQYNELKAQIESVSSQLGPLYDQRQTYIYKSMQQLLKHQNVKGSLKM